MPPNEPLREYVVEFGRPEVTDASHIAPGFTLVVEAADERDAETLGKRHEELLQGKFRITGVRPSASQTGDNRPAGEQT